MRKYVFKSNKTKIVVLDPEKYRSGNNNPKIKVTFEIWRLSKKRNGSEWRKIASHLIPRSVFKRLGMKMYKNDQEKISESGEVCLLEYE